MSQDNLGRPVRLRESANATTYTISDLAKEFDITTRAIRYYEDQGLITPARRGSRRIYTRRDRVRLGLILRGKRLGFSLQDSRELFDLYDNTPGKHAQMAHFMDLLGARRAMLQRQMEDIQAILKEIDAAENEARRSFAARERGESETEPG
ncbi:MerR family transcriptional regulator [Thauera phenylacetica]|jgi:DNA-binding transcriptional MerR regulator|uniref:MerR family transcriptional regulator n=1 Tax=Thauera phenylacetica B4P TaxID=1234382 RepID=N6ZT09_9RHOO|nr:MerR family DNA-binding transcriptional regulator [Thauera phenylacetica]ENO97632.1 MerR family transcriptional regulator [Thauera phenylacetica B4P]HRM67898.1 MerR family DNA-binding transcriptional regulator [Thauera phenylacetica]